MSKFRLNTIPLLPEPNYIQTVAIDGYRYSFDFQWNRRTNTHHLTITDSFGNVNLQRKRVLSNTTLYLMNLPPNSFWFLTYVNTGTATVLDKPSQHGLGAFVLE